MSAPSTEMKKPPLAPRRRPVLRWIGLIFLALLLVITITLIWALNSESGARFVLARAVSALDGKLSIGASNGSIAGPLVLENVRYLDPGSGIDTTVRRVALDVQLLSLLGKRVHVRDLAIDDVAVALTTQPPKQEEPTSEFSLDAPIDIVVDKLKLQRANVTQDGNPVFAVEQFDLIAAWTKSGIVVKQLDLRSPDGQVDLKGSLVTAGGYSGDGETEFRWKVADVDYAGKLVSHSDGKQTQLQFELSEPIRATLDASIAQNKNAAWNLTLEAPAFDAARLIPDSNLGTLAVNLQGSGDIKQGTLTGVADINGHRVQLDPLRYAVGEEVLHIEALTLRSPDATGALHAQGDVRYATNPPSTSLTLNWEGVELPADLVGQALATHGKIDLAGSAEAFQAEGNLSIGPPGQLSNLVVKLEGTPQQIALETLALKQAKGGLDARGTITLQPAMGWELTAKANALDPGAFAAEFAGAINFDLQTSGTLSDRGPDAKIKLLELSGTLHDRPISGQADLTIKPDFIVDGTANFRSGQSKLDLQGRGGSTTDASVRLDIASLGDWLPNAGGRLDGALRIHGKWPQLDIEGDAHARDLTFEGSRVTSLEMVASVKNIEQPAGAVTLKASGISNGDNRYDSLAIEANGNEASHQLSFEARGTPADLSLTASGAAKDGKWQGTLKTLGIDPAGRNVPRFDLEQATQLSWDGQRFNASESCLIGRETSRARTRADAAESASDGTQSRAGATLPDESSERPARLCVTGNGAGDGSLAANYRIEHLPLRLILRLAAPDSPVRLRGEIGGEGEFKRVGSGALVGTAKIASSEGRLFYGNETNQPALSYTDFAIDATLDAQSTRASVRAALNNDGKLDGRVTLSGAAGSPQQLDGQIQLELNSLAFLELITSEVSNAKGRLNANYAIGGTTAAPELNGALNLSDFAAEVPVAGLKLQDGNVALRAVGNQSFVLEGSIKSGKGSISIHGEGGLSEADAMKVSVKGEDFLAADIPAAKVLISPDLSLERANNTINVLGSVTVPSANVDFSKLPGGGVSSTSPDVVITDAKREEPGKPAPITANVTVILGDNVKLAGFGFDGSVAGQLVVNERPGRAATGTGTLNVGGTYKAYGQDLKIETGRVMFAGTAIDNPGIDIRAVRKIEADDVTAGLLVRGTAQIPVLTVFSEPAMEQSDALSYLITGKPLSSLKSGEGDMLGTAARALGTAGGDLLAKSIGGRLGVDDIGVADNAALGGAAFTVGKYLSPKLYLSYGVGIFEPGEVVTLRYLFHKRWNFEAQSATNGSRAGMNYRYEK
jgi:translocation and assembly module TamB